MLIITDINGNTEALSGYQNLKRYRNVSGEKTLAFFILPTDQNAHSFPMVAEESIVEFDGEPYRIKQLAEKSKGLTFYKEVVAVHTFFDLIDEHVYDLHNGSMTFTNALQFVLSGTGYTWAIVDTFYAQDFENFGDDNRLALFQEILKRYGAEFTLNGTHLTFRQKIGNATDFQFRYNYNVKTISRDVQTNNLSTYIKGYGKQNEDGTYVVESEYTSPNASVFGIRHAKPVRDERYTTLVGLNERLVTELNDTPEVSITIDFADLRRAGYPYDVPNEGDDVFLIYEPIGIDVEARLTEIEEEFDEASDYPYKTSVTLANIRESFTGNLIDTQKQIRDIVGTDGKVRYNVLDAAVKRATEALQSAQTELEFNNGIIAREKTDPNRLTLLNSAGFGISKDGGTTFKEAITADGFVLSAGAIGQLEANNIQIGPGTTFADGYGPNYGEIYVRGTGYNRSANRVLIANGKIIVEDAFIGLRLILIKKDDLSVRNNTLHDTFNNSQDRADLAYLINWYSANEPNQYIFILLSYDAIGWDDTLKNAVKTIGGSKFPNYRTPYALIGMDGIGEGSGLEVVTSEDANAPFAEITTKVINGIPQGISTQAKSIREDLRLSAPLPTSITMNQDGFRASNPDGTRYFQADYRGGYVKKGAFAIERDDGFMTMIDGKTNAAFDIQGSDPPHLVDATVNGRFFQTTSMNTNGADCNLYTFRRIARYVVFQVAIMSSTPNESKVILTQSGNEDVWLGSASTVSTSEVVQTITIDLGVPDGGVYALKMKLKSYSSTNTAYCRKIRAYQTDFI